MTGLLISVRNRQEAETVLTACPELDILDIKEPNAGALGAAPPQVWRDIAAINLNNTSLSIALGELNEMPVNALAELPPKTRYAKVGLAHQNGLNWAKAWRAMRALVLDSAELVGVIYADYEAAAAPTPIEVIERLSSEGCRTFLVDTYQKKGDNLFDHLTREEFNQFKARNPEAVFVLAGSLTESSIPRAKQLKAEFVGVRGAICENSRDGQVSAEKSKQLMNLVKTSS